MLHLQAETIDRRHLFIILSNQISYSSTHKEEHLRHGDEDEASSPECSPRGLKYW